MIFSRAGLKEQPADGHLVPPYRSPREFEGATLAAKARPTMRHRHYRTCLLAALLFAGIAGCRQAWIAGNGVPADGAGPAWCDPLGLLNGPYEFSQVEE